MSEPMNLNTALRAAQEAARKDPVAMDGLRDETKRKFHYPKASSSFAWAMGHLNAHGLTFAPADGDAVPVAVGDVPYVLVAWELHHATSGEVRRVSTWAPICVPAGMNALGGWKVLRTAVGKYLLLDLLGVRGEEDDDEVPSASPARAAAPPPPPLPPLPPPLSPSAPVGRVESPSDEHQSSSRQARSTILPPPSPASVAAVPSSPSPGASPAPSTASTSAVPPTAPGAVPFFAPPSPTPAPGARTTDAPSAASDEKSGSPLLDEAAALLRQLPDGEATAALNGLHDDLREQKRPVPMVGVVLDARGLLALRKVRETNEMDGLVATSWLAGLKRFVASRAAGAPPNDGTALRVASKDCQHAPDEHGFCWRCGSTIDATSGEIRPPTAPPPAPPPPPPPPAPPAPPPPTAEASAATAPALRQRLDLFLSRAKMARDRRGEARETFLARADAWAGVALFNDPSVTDKMVFERATGTVLDRLEAGLRAYEQTPVLPTVGAAT